MTVVNTDTGEVLDVRAAERRAKAIDADLDQAADRFEAAMEQMRAAIRDRDDLALGYRSPGDYLSDRFGGKLARLNVDLRREVVRELTEAGLSTRAIAPVVGVTQKTVVQDARQVIPQVSRPKSVTVGVDGKSYPQRPRSVAARQVHREDAETYLNLVQTLADKAAREALKLTPAQIARVKPKAAHWTDGLRQSVETLQRLLSSLTEEN